MEKLSKTTARKEKRGFKSIAGPLTAATIAAGAAHVAGLDEYILKHTPQGQIEEVIKKANRGNFENIASREIYPNPYRTRLDDLSTYIYALNFNTKQNEKRSSHSVSWTYKHDDVTFNSVVTSLKGDSYANRPEFNSTFVEMDILDLKVMANYIYKTDFISSGTFLIEESRKVYGDKRKKLLEMNFNEENYGYAYIRIDKDTLDRFGFTKEDLITEQVQGMQILLPEFAYIKRDQKNLRKLSQIFHGVINKIQARATNEAKLTTIQEKTNITSQPKQEVQKNNPKQSPKNNFTKEKNTEVGDGEYEGPVYSFFKKLGFFDSNNDSQKNEIDRQVKEQVKKQMDEFYKKNQKNPEQNINETVEQKIEKKVKEEVRRLLNEVNEKSERMIKESKTQTKAQKIQALKEEIDRRPLNIDKKQDHLLTYSLEFSQERNDTSAAWQIWREIMEDSLKRGEKDLIEYEIKLLGMTLSSISPHPITKKLPILKNLDPRMEEFIIEINRYTKEAFNVKEERNVLFEGYVLPLIQSNRLLDAKDQWTNLKGYFPKVK